MLALSRKRGQWIKIGEEVYVMVIRSGDNVRLGIVAPEEVQVLRGELVPEEFPGSRADLGQESLKAFLERRRKVPS